MTLAQPRSTTREHDLAIVIGRFQPFHNGHLHLIQEALKHSERVLILVGSANRARDTRNPFTFEERQRVIRDGLRDTVVSRIARTSMDPSQLDPGVAALMRRITIAPMPDFGDKMRWIISVQQAATMATSAVRPRVCLVGNVRDATSEYLSWFPTWPYLPVVDTGTNATGLREALFCDNALEAIDSFKGAAPATTLKFMRDFMKTPHYARLLKARAGEIAYKKRWGSGPFLTVDAVIRKGDHVLVIERGGGENGEDGGEGEIALPGGFHNAGERALTAACREAIEETGLFIPAHDVPTFKQWLKDCKAALGTDTVVPTPACVLKAMETLQGYQRGRGERFDDPYRSRRAHLITEAFLFDLPDGHGLPAVIGSDDARRAFWIPISEITPEIMFEDHAFIVDKMLSYAG